MAFLGNKKIITDEQLGAFSGYIRRPKPNVSGMTAQIFGEDGNDADTILALSLTKFQDAEVFTNIYLVKDPQGQIMKKNGAYPLIASFSSMVRRSIPTQGGMIAQLFSPNGEDADSITELSKSMYQDALVFVDIRGNLSKNKNINEENFNEIDILCLDKYTKIEKQQLLKQEKAFKKMNELLTLSEFLYKIEVYSSLGNKEFFKDWLAKHQTCSHLQENRCLNESTYTEVSFLPAPFNFLPVCDEHKSDLNSIEHIHNNKTYYEMKHRFLIKDWAWSVMKEKFSHDGKSEPDPNKIIEWATEKKLSNYLPEKYTNVVF